MDGKAGAHGPKRSDEVGPYKIFTIIARNVIFKDKILYLFCKRKCGIMSERYENILSVGKNAIDTASHGL